MPLLPHVDQLLLAVGIELPTLCRTFKRRRECRCKLPTSLPSTTRSRSRAICHSLLPRRSHIIRRRRPRAPLPLLPYFAVRRSRTPATTTIVALLDNRGPRLRWRFGSRRRRRRCYCCTHFMLAGEDVQLLPCKLSTIAATAPLEREVERERGTWVAADGALHCYRNAGVEGHRCWSPSFLLWETKTTANVHLVDGWLPQRDRDRK
nr:hypothetical protein Iba_chr06bCG13770 [Ipomoea batatas]